jgi:hypothetical protein
MDGNQLLEADMQSMYRRIATMIAIAVLPAAGFAADPRPCELLPSGEVAAVLGAAPGNGEAGGPEVDQGLSVTSWTCGWMANNRYLGMAVTRFRSVADATSRMRQVVEASRSDPDGVKLTAMPAPGEQAVWGGSEEGAVWFARKGDLVISVSLAMELKDPESQREPLRRLLVAALTRL